MKRQRNATRRRPNPWGPSPTVQRRGLHLGENVRTGRQVYVAPRLFFTHLHLIGPPGTGKTRLLLHLFRQLIELVATVILFNPKGALGQMARDAAIAGGHAARLILFDPGEADTVIGYNPLRPNGLPIPTQVKGVREAIRAAWGQTSFDQTPQLARLLLWALYTVRERGLTLIEAVDLLRPGSAVRAKLLPCIEDPYIREALAFFDGLRETRQEELAASSLARLEAFTLDPVIRRIFTQQARSLDLAEVIRERSILIVNLEQHRPLRTDDVRLVGRLLINDLVGHVFARPEVDRSRPVFLILDEMQTWLTPDLATALDQGRELGLGCILAHQHMQQLADEDAAGHLAASVTNCARSKIVFGGLSVEELTRHHVDDLFIDTLDPWRVKDELTSLELEPTEERRQSVTVTRSASAGRSVGRSTTQSQQTTRSSSRGTSLGVSHGRSTGRQWTETQQTAHGRGESESEVGSLGEIMSTMELYPAGADGLFPEPAVGSSVTTARAEAHGRGRGEHWTEGDAISEGESEIETTAHQRTATEEHGQARSTGRSRATSTEASVQRGGSMSVQESPWLSYRVTRKVSTRTFLSLDEQRTRLVAVARSQPKGHFIFRAPAGPSVFMRAPIVRPVEVSARQLADGRALVFSRGCYATPEAADAEDRARREQLARADKPQSTPPPRRGPKLRF